jgi:hypothetical protein
MKNNHNIKTYTFMLFRQGGHSTFYQVQIKVTTMAMKVASLGDESALMGRSRENLLTTSADYCQSIQEEEKDSLLVDQNPTEQEIIFRSRHFWFRTLILLAMFIVVSTAVSLFFSPWETNATNKGLVMNEGFAIASIRFQLAQLSIDMMRNDTEAAAEASETVDITPICDLVEMALDAVGARLVHTHLLDTVPFLVDLNSIARNDGLDGFYIQLELYAHSQPEVYYYDFPNGRDQPDEHLCLGCIWWLRHYVGAITADKLLRDGSLLWDASTGERVYNAPSFLKKLHVLQRERYADIMSFHAQHGFIWHYVTSTMPWLDEYPVELAQDFCGDVSADFNPRDYSASASTALGDECYHAFGHAIYFVLAARDRGPFRVQQPFRPRCGFVLSEDSMCEGYNICAGAPPGKYPHRECIGGFTHSYGLYRPNDGLSWNDRKFKQHLREQRARCEQLYK